MSLFIVRALIMVSAGLMATVFGLNAKLAALLVVLIIGGIWLANTYAQRRAISSIAFLMIVGIAAYGMLTGSSSWLWLIAIIFLIAAWDLEQLASRLARFDRIEGPIETAHIKRLAFVSLLALAVGGVALSLSAYKHISMGFGMALFIGVVLILGLIAALKLGVKTTD